MRYTFIIFLSLILCQACKQNQEKSDTLSSNKQTSTIDIDLDTFHRMMNSTDQIQLVDVRKPDEVAEGMIEGAIHIDYYDEDFSDQVDKLDKNIKTIVYCRSGGRSAKSGKILEQLGFQNIYNLKGGYTAYAAN